MKILGLIPNIIIKEVSYTYNNYAHVQLTTMYMYVHVYTTQCIVHVHVYIHDRTSIKILISYFSFDIQAL